MWIGKVKKIFQGNFSFNLNTYSIKKNFVHLLADEGILSLWSYMKRMRKGESWFIGPPRPPQTSMRPPEWLHQFTWFVGWKSSNCLKFSLLKCSSFRLIHSLESYRVSQKYLYPFARYLVPQYCSDIVQNSKMTFDRGMNRTKNRRVDRWKSYLQEF